MIQSLPDRWLLQPWREIFLTDPAMLDHCPGAANLRTPTLAIKKCPQCGDEVELFSNDVSVKCSTCGFEVFNDTISCVQWCKYAKECVGEETYHKVMAQLKAQENAHKTVTALTAVPASARSRPVPAKQSHRAQ